MSGRRQKQRKQLERALRDAEARYRAFLAHSTEGIWRFELDAPIDASQPAAAQVEQMFRRAYLAECNDALARMYGYERAADIVGARLPDMMVETDPQNTEYLRAFVESGYRLSDVESVERDRAGATRYFSNSLTGIVESGRLVRAWGVQRDVTERQVLLARERAARAAAEEANRVKDEFLATVSHELRTPLTAILGWTRMLASGVVPEDSRRRALETIERNARAQVQLIEDLLDFSRIVSGKLRLDVAPVEAASIVEMALETVRPAAEAKGVRLEPMLDPNAGLLLADAGRLQQVVWNLLTNAIKFTPKGGRVVVTLRRLDGRIEIVVADTGRGIPADFVPFVFDRFRQAEAGANRAHGGLGLGLAIVRHLVELHGGEVEARSEGVDRGATFIVRLQALAERARPAAAASDEGAAPRPAELSGARVLVVEDDLDTRELLRELLASSGAVVEASTTAAEAMEAFLRAPPDLVVSDVAMPGQTGYDLVRQIRALSPERGGRVPVVALTAYVRAEDRLKALRAGFTTHVPKPIEPAELLAVLAALLPHAPGARRG